MTPLAWIVVVVGAVVLGLAAQLIMRSNFPYRWIVTAVAALIGAVGTSEWLFNGTTPEYEGIAVWPALAGGLVVGVVVDLIVQWFAGQQATGGQGHGAAVR